MIKEPLLIAVKFHRWMNHSLKTTVQYYYHYTIYAYRKKIIFTVLYDKYLKYKKKTYYRSKKNKALEIRTAFCNILLFCTFLGVLKLLPTIFYV